VDVFIDAGPPAEGPPPSEGGEREEED
jgi:hypothetical protein